MHPRRGAPLPSDHEEGRPMIDHEEIFDFVVVGGGPAGATAADDLAKPGPQGCASRPERTHQALRRGDPAAADPRFRNSESPFEGAGAACDDDLAKRAVRGHADRWRRLCRNGRSRLVRRMAARSRSQIWRDAACRPVREDHARRRRRRARVHFAPKAGRALSKFSRRGS